MAVVEGGSVSNPGMVTAVSYTQITEICETCDGNLFWLTKELILSGHSFTLDKLQSYLLPLQLDVLI